MKAFTLTVYAVFGAAALGAGTVALLMPGVISGEATSGLTAHLIREQAAGFVFIGLMFLWCRRHFDERRPVHLALLLFTGLFAAIHWADYIRSPVHVRYALVNTLPALVLAITAPFHRGAR